MKMPTSKFGHFWPKTMDVTKTRNWEPGTGNGERGTGNMERESGNECTAVILIRI